MLSSVDWAPAEKRKKFALSSVVAPEADRAVTEETMGAANNAASIMADMTYGALDVSTAAGEEVGWRDRTGGKHGREQGTEARRAS